MPGARSGLEYVSVWCGREDVWPGMSAASPPLGNATYFALEQE